MADTRYYLGFDCGNSSIRTVLGEFDGSHIKTSVIHQVQNRAIKGHTYEFWDILNIFYHMQKGLKYTLDAHKHIASFGISTWGIDFGFLGASGELITNPLCYRNPLGKIGMDSLSEQEQREVFFSTGIQNHPMNSMYQMRGIQQKLPEYFSAASHVLLISDLLNYLFTGEMNSEASIASTMQLLDMRTQQYNFDLIKKMGLESSLFSPMRTHGEPRGTLIEYLAQKFSTSRIPAICVPSHDTASAVVAVPTREKDFIFISSGTWSLIGTELQEPIINEEVYQKGFSNEGGAFGTVTMLKNSAGMHILENIKREIEFTSSRAYSWDEIIDMSRSALADPLLKTFDPNHEMLYNPDSMIKAIQSITGDPPIGRVIASAYKSLAASYADTVKELESVIGKIYPEIHMIGGGARNDHLNQMTADLSGKVVTVGPVEATSLGIVAVQVLHDNPRMSIADVREIIRDSTKISRFLPKT